VWFLIVRGTVRLPGTGLKFPENNFSGFGEVVSGARLREQPASADCRTAGSAARIVSA
jgi:hypothetical protein